MKQLEKTYSIFDSNNDPVYNLNEIEFYKGHLLANVYLDKDIAVIDLENEKLDR